MAGRGGYQRPGTPAAASGPGKFSRRTDGAPSEDNMKQAARYVSGGDYGDGQDMMAIQQGAPMAAADAPPRRQVVPFGAPTMRPDEPVTAGSPMGAGPGPESWESQFVDPQADVDAVAAAVRAAYEQFPSPYLRILVQRLEMEGR